MSVELAQAYVTIIPSAKGSERAIGDELNGILGGQAVSEAGETAGDTIGAGLISSLGKMAVPAAVVAGVAGAAKGLYEIGETFDSAYDTIALGTGATGEALDLLNDSFGRVVQTMPGDIETMASTFADLNTRTGATGEVLETLTGQFTALDLIGYGSDVGTVTAAFNAWGIEAEKMPGYLDDLFTISQTTGTSIDQLAAGVSGSAGAWTSMGFSFEQAAAMVGQFEKAGLDASGMAAKMAQNIGDLTLEGETNQEAFQRLTGEMQTYMAAGDDATARDIAEQLFGTRNADAFLQALETGVVDIDALTLALEDNDGAILSSEQGTRDFSENLELLKNNAALALEPLGSELFGAVGDLLASAVGPATDLAAGFADIAQAFVDGEGNFGPVKERLEGIGDAAGVLTGNLGLLGSDGLAVVADLCRGDFGAAFGDAHTLLTDVGTTLNDMVDAAFPDAVQGINDLIDAGGETFSSAWETVTGALDGARDAAGEAFTSAFDAARDAVTGMADSAAEKVEEAFPGISEQVGSLAGCFAEGDWPGAWEAAGSVVGTVSDGILEKVDEVFPGASETIAGLVTGSQTAFDNWGIADTVKGIFDDVGGFISDPVGTAAEAVDGFVSDIQGWIDGLDFSLPSIKLPHFNIDGGEIPWGIGGAGTPPSISVSWYARGGVFNGAQVVGVGEAGPEAIVPLIGPAMQPFAQAIADNLRAGGGGTTVVIDGARVNDGEAINKAVGDFIRELVRLGAI